MSEPGIDWKRLDNDSFLALISTEKRAFDFCFKFGLIDQSRRCNCGRQMEIQINRQEKHGLHFVCTASRSICSKKRTMLADTFFYRARISIRTCLKCIAGFLLYRYQIIRINCELDKFLPWYLLCVCWWVWMTQNWRHRMYCRDRWDAYFQKKKQCWTPSFKRNLGDMDIRRYLPRNRRRFYCAGC
jgi:hypothetical protein